MARPSGWTIAPLALLCACADDGAPAPTTCPNGFFAGNGQCVAAGVPPENCAPGFAPDGMHGCAPVLPDEPCAPGELALPGEVSCHPLVTCGTGRWGDAPTDASTVFVDASYAGGDADGSEDKPWPTIGAAIASAPAGALVAIAAGTYAEDVVLDEPLHLHGHCPATTTIAGTSRFAALRIAAGESSVRSLSISAPGGSLVMAAPVELERLWLRDASDVILDLVGAGVSARDLLIEGEAAGVRITGGSLALDRTVMQGVQLGVFASYDLVAGDRPSVVVSNTVIDPSDGFGVFALDADVAADALVVLSATTAVPDGAPIGIFHIDSGATPDRPRLELRRSYLGSNQSHSLLLVGSDALIEDTVVRDTVPRNDGSYGRAIGAQGDLESPTVLTLRRSLVDAASDTGIYLLDAEATIEASIVRNVVPVLLAEGALFGDGVTVLSEAFAAKLTLRDSSIEASDRVGVANYGASVHLERSRFECNTIDLDGETSYLLHETAIMGAYAFDDAGGNRCGCDGVDSECQVRSTSVTAPEPADPPGSADR